MFEITVCYTLGEQKLQKRASMEKWEKSKILEDAWTVLDQFHGPAVRQTCVITRVFITQRITVFDENI